jgi:protein-L-isoaspartate(D-aspartate) O-methyltransferase
MNLQEALLEKSLSKYQLSPEVQKAYRNHPRHLFVKRSYTMEEMYGDYPLELYNDGNFISTISQPSFVMLMIDMLELKPGHKVLELGAGSGWNAALIGDIIGPTGKVVSVEIISELASETRENLKGLGIQNVEIITGDGMLGYSAEAPYDRAVFTAGAGDFPRAFHDQIKDEGLVLFVLKGTEVDYLFKLRKVGDHFEEISRMGCRFVPVKGRFEFSPDDVVSVDKPLKIFRNPKNGGRNSLFSTT